MHRNSYFSDRANLALSRAWGFVANAGNALREAARVTLELSARGAAAALNARSPWPWFAMLAIGSPWLRLEIGAWTVYPGHWALAIWLAFAWLHASSGQGGEPVPLKGPLLLCGYVVALLLFRSEWARALGILGATLANLAWGWAAYQAGRRGERAEVGANSLLMLVVAALGVELATWTLAIFWPPGCALFNCPPWPEDPPRFRGGFAGTGQFGLFAALVWPALAVPLLLARQGGAAREARYARMALMALAAALGLALLAGGGAWLLPVGLLIWLGLARALRPFGDPRDRLWLRNLALWMAVGTVLFYALFPGYLGQWFSLDDPPWSHVRIDPVGTTPRALSSERTTVFLMDVTNDSTFPLPEGAAIVPRLLITPARGRLIAHDLPPAPFAEGLGGREKTQIAVPVRLPPWVQEGFLSWQVRSPDGRTAVPAGGSSVGLRFLNADFRSLADARENVLSALAARTRAYHSETFVPDLGAPGRANAEKVIGELLDTVLFSPLWGEFKIAVPPGAAFPANRPLLTQLTAEFGLVALAGLLYLGWMAASRAELLGQRTTKPAARFAWPLVTASLAVAGVLALFSPAPGTFHGQWGLFLLLGWIEGRHDRLVPARLSGGIPGRSGVRAWVTRFMAQWNWRRWLSRLPRAPRLPRPAQGSGWPKFRFPAIRWPFGRKGGGRFR